MVLACVLFALITVGIVVPCVIDAATSPPWAVRTLARRDWILVIIACSIFGCAAWLIAGRPRRMPLARWAAVPGMGEAEAFRRHPAGRALDSEAYYTMHYDQPACSRPLGPDDDDEFLMELERRIRESRGEDR
jgi:hypothetical protein